MSSIPLLGTIYIEYKVQGAEIELWSLEQVHADAVTGRWRDEKIVIGIKFASNLSRIVFFKIKSLTNQMI